MATPRADALKSVRLFAGLSGAELELLAGSLDEVSLPAGTTLIREGQGNHSFFVLLDGRAEVSVAGQPRRTLGPGGFFGEISVSDGLPATATVVAATPIRAYELSPTQFGVLAANPAVLGCLRAAAAARLLVDRRRARLQGVADE